MTGDITDTEPFDGAQDERRRMIGDLLTTAAYPHPVESVRMIETHISNVFLTGEFVYKIKKPVRYDFVDYTEPETRRWFVKEEIRLNRELNPDTYLGVSKIVRLADGGYVIDGEGEVAEYAVRMRQLPEERNLANLAVSGEVDADVVAAVARKIAEFHASAVRPESTTPLRERVTHRVEDNFHVLSGVDYLGERRVALEEAKAYSHAFLRARADQVDRREADGRVVECHGDLHAGNIFLLDSENPIRIIDRIEFNRDLTDLDPANEVAFLAMDLEERGQNDLATVFVDEYIAASGDEVIREFLTFYKVYRALVRAKVTHFRVESASADDPDVDRLRDEVRDYVALAGRYVALERPNALIVFAGLSGVGKSALARTLAERWAVRRISSDVVRKELAGVPLDADSADVPGGLYGAQMNRQTYAELIARGEEVLADGPGVILDATFNTRTGRIKAKEAAHRNGLESWLVECVLDTAVHDSRMARRTADQAEGSDADMRVLAEQRRYWQAIEASDSDRHIAIDTSGTFAETFARLLEELWVMALTPAD